MFHSDQNTAAAAPSVVVCFVPLIEYRIRRIIGSVSSSDLSVGIFLWSAIDPTAFYVIARAAVGEFLSFLQILEDRNSLACGQKEKV